MDNELREEIANMEIGERAYFRRILIYFAIVTGSFAIIGGVIKIMWSDDHGNLILGFVGVYLGVIWTLLAARAGTMGNIDIMKILLKRMEHLEKEIQRLRCDK